MAVLVSKPGLTSASTLSIPKDWSAAWFRSLIANQLVGADVRNAVGANGITISGTIASPYATIQPSSPFIVPTPAGGTARFAVGTTPRSWASGCPSIDLGDCGLMAYPSGADDLLYLAANLYWDGGFWRYVSTNPGCMHTLNSAGGFAWYSAPSGASGSAATLLNTMLLDSSGNLSTAGNMIAGGNIQAIGGVYYGKGSNNAIEDAGDGYLRFNNAGSYGNGIFTPYNVRIDGILYTTAAGGYFRSASSGGMSYGSWAVGGAQVGGYEGIGIVDGAKKPIFMSNGTNAGIYYNGSSYWLCYDNGTNFIVPHAVLVSSDAQLKTSVSAIPDALARINKLRGTIYTRKDSGARELGVIAQEVRSVFPELVAVIADTETDDVNKGMLSVHYDGLIAVAIEAIKDLTAKVNEQATQIAKLTLPAPTSK